MGVAELNESPRALLSRLDALLDELEDLNLRDMRHISVRVGSAMQEFGIDNPYGRTVSELLDLVFERQEPILATIRSKSVIRRYPSGWPSSHP